MKKYRQIQNNPAQFCFRSEVHKILYIYVFSCFEGADVIPEVGCEKCGCCVEVANTTTCGYNSTVDYEDFCFNGCKTGFWGNRCYHKCDKNCVACARNPVLEEGEVSPVCTECPDGKYLGPDRTCTLSCLKQCLKCSTNDSCSQCKTPYFNTDTITNCSAFCPSNCICDRYDHCSRCKPGFYDVSKSCSSACSGSCEDCVSATQCTECISGRYGNTCEFNCSSSCLNDTCSKDDGSCICKPLTFYGSYCPDNQTTTTTGKIDSITYTYLILYYK